MQKRFLLSFLVLFIFSNVAFSQLFSDYFVDETLRIDYLWIGNKYTQEIAIDEISRYPHWAGRQINLSTFPLAGDGEVTVYSEDLQHCIYKTTFSSLFHEWLETPEAKNHKQGFEHTVLLPYPKEKVKIQVKLFNINKKVIAELTQTFDPTDILIRKKTTASNKYRYIIKNGSSHKCIDIAILAEGYTQNEEALFFQDAKKATESIFSHEPIQSLQQHFNVVAVHSLSKESGVSVPNQKLWKETAFLSHFDTFYSKRYLTTQKVQAIHDALSGIPYEHIIILANTKQYGGGGIFNSFTLTNTQHPAFAPVVVHEFGHSFAGLADEYFYEEETSDYPLDLEPWEQNITTLIDFKSKWKDMLIPDTPIPTPIDKKETYPIGVYEGARYMTQKMYRPAFNCRMRTNAAPDFCPVCQRAITKLISFYTQENN